MFQDALPPTPNSDRRVFGALCRWRASDATKIIRDLDFVSDRAAWSDLVVVFTPILQLFAGIGKAHTAMSVRWIAQVSWRAFISLPGPFALMDGALEAKH